MPFATFQSPLFIETSKESLSYAVLENALIEGMRDVLPFCEDLGQRKLEDAVVANDTVRNFYVGHVDLVADQIGGKASTGIFN